MSEYDNNPFVDPVDVNPFQVRPVLLYSTCESTFHLKAVRDMLPPKPVWLVSGFGLTFPGELLTQIFTSTRCTPTIGYLLI